MNKFLSNKKAVVGVVVAAVVVIGGIIGGVSYHNTQVAKEKEKAEKEAKAHLEELTGEFDTAKFQIENAILEDAERTTLLESLNGYEKKLDGISKEDEKEFDTLRTSIEEKYTASAATLDNAVAGITTTYPTEEGYYTEEFTASVNALMEELNTLKADGKYQEAFNKFNEINGTYAAYVEEVNAEKAAAEEAAKKAEAESKKNSSSTSTAKNSNGGSNSGSGSSGSSSNSTNTASSSGSSSEQTQGTVVQKTDVPIISEDKSTIKYPDDWTIEQIAEWNNQFDWDEFFGYDRANNRYYDR